MTMYKDHGLFIKGSYDITVDWNVRRLYLIKFLFGVNLSHQHENSNSGRGFGATAKVWRITQFGKLLLAVLQYEKYGRIQIHENLLYQHPMKGVL